MYQYSLDFFKGLFATSIANSEPSDDLEERLGFLNKEFLEALYRNICRSLFEKDKLTFSTLITLKLMEMAKETNAADLKFLLTGGVSLGDVLPDNPAEWLSEKLWGEMNRLDKLDNFKGWVDHFNKNHIHYRGMYDAQYPQDFELLEPFDKLDKL